MLERVCDGPHSCTAAVALLSPLYELWTSRYKTGGGRSSSRRCRNPHCNRADVAEQLIAAMKVTELCCAALANLAKNRTCLHVFAVPAGVT
jgi:hypothetical protein